MTDGDTVAQVAVVVLLLVLAVPALATAHELAGTPFDFEDQATVSYGSTSAVSANATVEGYGTDPTITANGTTLVAGTDYAWNATSGTVTWFNTSKTSSGDAATIEYQAYQRTGETALAWTIIAPLMGVFGLFALVSAVRALWELTAEVWSL